MQSGPVNKRSQQNLIFYFKKVKLKKKLQTLFEWLGNIRSGQLSLTLTSFDWRIRVERTLVQTLASQLSSTLTSFDRHMRVERTLVQTLASQLSSTLILVWLAHESWENSRANSRFSTLINSRLVWLAHESWENSRANSRFSTLINSRLVWLAHESWENSRTNSRFSTLINSRLVWPAHESWENSRANSRFSTLTYSHPRFTRPLANRTQLFMIDSSAGLNYIVTSGSTTAEVDTEGDMQNKRKSSLLSQTWSTLLTCNWSQIIIRQLSNCLLEELNVGHCWMKSTCMHYNYCHHPWAIVVISRKAWLRKSSFK